MTNPTQNNTRNWAQNSGRDSAQNSSGADQGRKLKGLPIMPQPAPLPRPQPLPDILPKLNPLKKAWTSKPGSWFRSLVADHLADAAIGAVLTMAGTHSHGLLHLAASLAVSSASLVHHLWF